MTTRSGAPEATIEGALEAALAPHVTERGRADSPHPGGRIVVGLSGGRDSMVLLEATSRMRASTSMTLAAVHVHHGLSPHADRWAEFCRRECERRSVPLTVARVAVRTGGGRSLEAEARTARYAAFAGIDADALLLAHHADDQAETVLLQLLRGAGPAGIAAMPHTRSPAPGPVLVRPLLDLAADVLAAYARQQALAWIEDESNHDPALRRNALRQQVIPAVRAAFPGYPATLVRAARHQADAAHLLDVLARLDAGAIAQQDVARGLVLDVARFAALAESDPVRASNLLRWFLRQHRLPSASTARLAAFMRQCRSARRDSRAELQHAGAIVALHHGRVLVRQSVPHETFSVRWRDGGDLVLPGGTLHARPSVGAGLAAHVLEASDGVLVRSRAGGERLRIAVNRPRQALTALFQAAGTPRWERSAWPLLWHGDMLAAVPGLGIDPGVLAAPGEAGYALEWRPRRD